MKLNKKTLLIIGILIAALGAGIWLYQNLIQSQTTARVPLRTATIERGSIQSTLTASGAARSGQTATITWHTSGKVGEVTFKLGDQVTAGQELAALDPNTMSTSLTSARQTLVDAKKALDDLLNSKMEQAKAFQTLQEAQQTSNTLKQTANTNRAAAQLALATAQSNYNDAKKARTALNYPHSTDKLVIENAQTKYLLAKDTYKEALKAYNIQAHKRLTNLERARALENLLAAKQKMQSALTTYNWYILKPTSLEIAEADANLAVAKAALDKAQADWKQKKDGVRSEAAMLAEATLADAQRAWERVKDGPSPEDIDAAEATVAAAQAAVDQAHLVAPFDGVITKVDVRSGDQVSSGTAAFRIDDMESIYIDLQVSEVDIQKLQVGQQAALTFDAIENREYAGEVTEIGAIASSSQGVVNYPVTIWVTDADENVRPGLTAAVSIVIDQHDDVLLVPSRAIRTANNQRTVTILFEGQQIAVPVTVGLTSSSMTEIISEQLQEGDTVVLQGTAGTSSSSSSNQNRNNPGNPGFGGPGGGGMPPGP